MKCPTCGHVKGVSLDELLAQITPEMAAEMHALDAWGDNPLAERTGAELASDCRDITINITPAEHAQLELIARATDRTIDDVVNEGIRLLLEARSA